METYNIISIIFILIAGLCNGIMDVLKHKHQVSYFKNHIKDSFFGELSWKRRYKDKVNNKQPIWYYQGFLVMFMDGWHLFKEFMLLSFIIALLSFNFSDINFISFMLYLILFRLIFTLGFYITYKYFQK